MCVTSGGNYKRYRLSVRLAGVFDSRVIDLYTVAICIFIESTRLPARVSEGGGLLMIFGDVENYVSTVANLRKSRDTPPIPMLTKTTHVGAPHT